MLKALRLKLRRWHWTDLLDFHREAAARDLEHRLGGVPPYTDTQEMEPCGEVAVRAWRSAIEELVGQLQETPQGRIVYRLIQWALPVDAEDRFSEALAEDPRFNALMERSRERYPPGSGKSLPEIKGDHV